MPGKGLAGKASIDMLKVNCQELRIYKVPVLLRPATTNYQLYSKANLRGPKRFRNSPALYAQNDIAGCSNSSYLFVENKQKVNAHSFLQTSPYITDSPQNPEKHIKDSNAKAGVKKATKVFLSEKQSQYTKECGILMPGAPPATPTPEHLKQFHYVPSLTDIKAQRHIRQRLEGMARKEQKKGANKQDSQFQLEKISLREQQQDLKQQQRLEIYALNHVMKALENKQFEDFLIRQGLPRF